MAKSGLAFHVNQNKLVEFCDDYDVLLDCIKSTRPLDERKLCLRLLKMIPKDKIPGKDSILWKACMKAVEDYEKAENAYVGTWKVYMKGRHDCAWESWMGAEDIYYMVRHVYNKAWESYLDAYAVELEKLHKELCPNCPWDGHSIFPMKI